MKIALKGISYGSLLSLIAIWGCALAEVPHTFYPDTPALSSEVNENFSSLDTRLTSVEKDTVDINIDDYITPFSADGEPKNVIVLRGVAEDARKTYWVRSFYANSSETVSICGTPTVQPYIAAYPIIATDAVGNVEYISGYIESYDNEAFSGINIEESSYEPDGSNKQVTADALYESSSCSGNAMRVCVMTLRSCSSAGEYVETFSSVKSRSVLQNPLAVGSDGWVFNQVMVDAVLRDSFSWILRIRAKGIGQIFGKLASGYERSVIYYRVNGETQGSLAGTPFDAGQPLEGLFF